MSKRVEMYLSLILIVLILLFGRFYLSTDMLFFRLIVGVSLGHIWVLQVVLIGHITLVLLD